MGLSTRRTATDTGWFLGAVALGDMAAVWAAALARHDMEDTQENRLKLDAYYATCNPFSTLCTDANYKKFLSQLERVAEIAAASKALVYARLREQCFAFLEALESADDIRLAERANLIDAHVSRILEVLASEGQHRGNHTRDVTTGGGNREGAHALPDLEVAGALAARITEEDTR